MTPLGYPAGYPDTPHPVVVVTLHRALHLPCLLLSRLFWKKTRVSTSRKR